MFDVHVNEEFSLLEKTGLTVGKGWKHPYILYCYKELISNQFMWDGKLELQKITEDKYILNTVDKDIDNASVVTVLVMESDEEGNIPTKLSQTLNNSWKTIETVSPNFKRFKLVDVNENNDYTFSIKDMNINPNTMQVMYFIEEMVYFPSCFHIKIDLNKIDDYTYKVNLQQKYCDIQNMLEKKSGYNSTQTDILTNVGSCRYEIDMESNEENVVSEEFFTIRLDGKELGKSMTHAYIGGGYISYQTSLTEELYFKGKNKSSSLQITPRNSNLTYWYRLFSYSSSNKFFIVDNYKLKIFILGEEYDK